MLPYQLGQLQSHVGVFKASSTEVLLKLVYRFHIGIYSCICRSGNGCGLELHFSIQKTVVYWFQVH